MEKLVDMDENTEENQVEAVLASHDDGVRAIERIAAVAEWDAITPCGTWQARDLVGHLLAIVRYYHRLLDAASAGNPRAGLPRGSNLATMNAQHLAALAEVDGDERAHEFVVEADAYVARLRAASWTMILGLWSDIGRLTVEQHAGLVLGEWHVHAWDLARSVGADHHPDDALIVAKGQEIVSHRPHRGDPWTEVLQGYGRDPGWLRHSDRVG
jgi:Mycothiol maleylpyruvate isomerase N-terminal domain